MRTAESGPDSPSTAILATLPVAASGHPGNLGENVAMRPPSRRHRGDWWEHFPHRESPIVPPIAPYDTSRDPFSNPPLVWGVFQLALRRIRPASRFLLRSSG